MDDCDVSQSCIFNDPPVLLQTCQVGLNFASEEEARRFRTTINDLLNRRQRKTGMALGLYVFFKTAELHTPGDAGSSVSAQGGCIS